VRIPKTSQKRPRRAIDPSEALRRVAIRQVKKSHRRPQKLEAAEELAMAMRPLPLRGMTTDELAAAVERRASVYARVKDAGAPKEFQKTKNKVRRMNLRSAESGKTAKSAAVRAWVAAQLALLRRKKSPPRHDARELAALSQQVTGKSTVKLPRTEKRFREILRDLELPQKS
jgi:hypothetical protein